MNRTALVVVFLALALIGLADAWYLFQAAVTHSALSCDIGAGLDGCNIVAKSAYSYLFGVPLALYGVGMYALLFVLGALLLVVSNRTLYRVIFWLTVVGALASLIFVFIQVTFIKAICIYCFVSAGISLLLFVLARRLWQRFAPPYLVLVKEG